MGPGSTGMLPQRSTKLELLPEYCFKPITFKRRIERLLIKENNQKRRNFKLISKDIGRETRI